MSKLECKYCPKNAAAFYCENCDISFCLSCVPEDNQNVAPRCTLCRRSLDSVNSRHVIPAFWTQWLYFFKIAISPSIFISLLIFSLLAQTLPTEGFTALVIGGIYWGLLLMMLFELTNLLAEGRSDTISLTEIWREGEPFLLVRLLLQVLFVGLLVIGIGGYFGDWATVSMLVLYGLGFPASVLILSIEKRFFSAANPLRIIYVINGIGLPYLYLYVSWLVALGLSIYIYNNQLDTNIISHIIYTQLSYLLWTAWFAQLGYATFQYHQQLAIAVSPKHKYQHQKKHTNNAKKVKSAAIKEAEILIAEDRSADALNLLLTAINQPMVESDVARFYLKLLISQNELKRLSNIAQQLVRQYIHQNNLADAIHIASQATNEISDWSPRLISDTYLIANGLNEIGQRKSALFLFETIISTDISDKNEDFSIFANCYFEAAKLNADYFNQDQQAIEQLSYLIKNFTGSPIILEAKTYLQVLKSSNNTHSLDDALDIDD